MGPNGLQQPQQPRRRGVDPEAVPSPIVVADEDQARWRDSPYVASSKQNPPLSATKVRVIDEGNASFRFIRPTLNAVPCTKELLKLSKVGVCSHLLLLLLFVVIVIVAAAAAASSSWWAFVSLSTIAPTHHPACVVVVCATDSHDPCC